jgi:hypothetical protein
MYKFSLANIRQLASTTPDAAVAAMRVVPMWCQPAPSQ